MSQRKRLFSFIVIFIFISILASTTVLARNLYIDTAITSLSISSSGTATATGYASGYQGTTTQLKIYLDLQQYKNGSWQTIKSWSETFNTHRGNLSDTYNVASGYKYRVKATYYGYGTGGGYDEIITYSNEVNY